MPKISVIVPIYNGEKFLKECVESIINQTFDNIEVILVDNKSTDRTGEICDIFASKDNRVKVIHRTVHGWISDGRNDGLQIAKGEWVTFVDADDWLNPDHYERIIEKIANSNIDIFCQGGCICEYPDKSVIKYTGTGDFLYKDKNSIINLAKHIFVPVYNDNPSPINMSAPWDKFFRREFLMVNKLQFDTEVFFADDSYFNISAFINADIVGGMNYIGYHYRQLSSSVTHNYRPDWPDKIYGYLSKLDKFMKLENINEELEDAKNFTTLRCFLNMLRGYYLHPKNNLHRNKVKNELIEWKNKELYKAAISQRGNKLLTKNLKIFKLILKTNMLFPLELLFWIERKKNV